VSAPTTSSASGWSAASAASNCASEGLADSQASLSPSTSAVSGMAINCADEGTSASSDSRFSCCHPGAVLNLS